MFPIDYALLDGDGAYRREGDRTLIAVDDKLDAEEKYALSIVSPGLVTKRGSLLISGQIEGSVLPATEFLLVDVPDDVLEDILQNGASVVDSKNNTRIEFGAVLTHDNEVNCLA